VIGASVPGPGGSGWRLSVTASVEEVGMSALGSFVPCLVRPVGQVPALGDPLVDEYLRFTAARVRANTLTAQVFDLKVFFTVVAKPPEQVTVTDVLASSRPSAPHGVAAT
jgi:hypothetical protein